MVSREEYSKMVEQYSPDSKTGMNLIKAFLSGGIICAIGQCIRMLLMSAPIDEETAAGLTSVIMVFIGVSLTAIGVYDRIAKFAGAGTLVPITGFANSMSSPAMEFKAEGYILGMAAKMFIIAGPVIVYGVSAGMVYGLIYWVAKMI